MAALGDRDGRGAEPAPGPQRRDLVLFVLLQLIIMAASLAAVWPLLARLFK